MKISDLFKDLDKTIAKDIFDGAEYQVKASNVDKNHWDALKTLQNVDMFKDSIETATLRAVRTGISQMTAQIQLARAKEMGVNLVIVSSHLGARPSHEEWQGKIYSVDWNSLNI